jgi:urease accessory protein
MAIDHVALLRLLHLSDSALPIGSAAHSFGLEMLIADGQLDVEALPAFLTDYLQEAGLLEAAYCRFAYQSADDDEWLRVNQRLSAYRTARETREASITLGRRFLQLAAAMSEAPELAVVGTDIHLATAFGKVGRFLNLPITIVSMCYLHQSLAGLISACQRLLPLGQSHASCILWDLKPAIVTTVERSLEIDEREVHCFTPGLDIASMRHPQLATRLFIS